MHKVASLMPLEERESLQVLQGGGDCSPRRLPLLRKLEKESNRDQGSGLIGSDPHGERKSVHL